MRPELVVVTLTRDPIDHRVHAAAASQPASQPVALALFWGGRITGAGRTSWPVGRKRAQLVGTLTRCCKVCEARTPFR